MPSEKQKLRRFVADAVRTGNNDQLSIVYDAVARHDMETVARLPKVMQFYARNRSSCAVIKGDWHAYSEGNDASFLWYLWSDAPPPSARTDAAGGSRKQVALRQAFDDLKKVHRRLLSEYGSAQTVLLSHLSGRHAPAVLQQTDLVTLVHMLASDLPEGGETMLTPDDNTTAISAETEIVAT